VGRAVELARLGDLVAEVAAGVGRALLVVGEQGVGKTALLREGLAGAEVLGCRMGWGTGDEFQQGFPLRMAAECLGQEGREAVSGPGGWGVLAGDPVLAGVERLLELVDRLCAVSPVVVVAEDLQWADEASVLVWRRLAQAARQVPLLVVGSLRPGPAREDLAQLQRGLVAHGDAVVSLGPLPLPEVEQLASGLLGAVPGPQLAGVLARAGGNPLYVRELVEALVREGLARRADGVTELTGEPGALRVPTSLVAAIAERLEVLPGNAMAVLRWAAVLGLEFSVSDLKLVSGRPTGELADMMQAAVSAGVVAEVGQRLAFRHALIRQVLYEQIPRPARETLHLEAARALAAAGAAPERVAAQLVVVEAEAAEWEWVWEWLAKAVPVLTYQAPRVAAQLLRRALAQVPEAHPGREVLEAGLVRVGFLLMQEEEVERVARSLLARTTDPDCAAEVSWLLAYVLSRAGQKGEAALVEERALGRPGVSAVWTARLRARQAMTQALLHHSDGAVQIASQALVEAEQAGDRFAVGYALYTLSYVAYLQRDQEGSLGHIDRALAVIGDDPQTTDLRILLLSNRVAALGNLDRLPEAGTTVQEALALAEQTGTPRLTSVCISAAEYYFEVGQWDNATTVLETASELPCAVEIVIRTHRLIAEIAAHRNDWGTAEAHLAAGRDKALRSLDAQSAARYLFGAEALAAERATRTGEAVTLNEQYLDPTTADHVMERHRIMPPLTRLALATGARATAAAAAQAAGEEARRAPLPNRTATADWCRGLVDGDPGPVLEAAAYYKSTGRPADQGRALEDAAVLLAGRGDLAEARRAFTDAARLYQDLSADYDLRRADAQLRRYGIRRGRGGRARSATGWDALTPVEATIAALIADGRSNPDIAAHLFLSRNTVQTHVSHILAKLGARSRAEIIRQAFEHSGDERTAD
jgi:DNA-binding CsgD family transcriptional regulator